MPRPGEAPSVKPPTTTVDGESGSMHVTRIRITSGARDDSWLPLSPLCKTTSPVAPPPAVEWAATLSWLPSRRV